MHPTPVSNPGADGSLAPLVVTEDPRVAHFPKERGAVRWTHIFGSGQSLESLGINDGGDVLVVSFHGALDRERYTLPRFERMASIRKLGYSSLYIADPSLHLSSELQLAWYTGWPELGLLDLIAEQCVRAANDFGARTLILSGSSGGGYAALQIGARIDGSISLAFNPQTHIHGYLYDGQPGSHGVERAYIEHVYPDAAPEGIWRIDFDHDWSEAAGPDYSAIRAYGTPRGNRILYANNVNDWHVAQHYEPFAEQYRAAQPVDRLTELNYDGRVGHFPPSPDEFEAGMAAALALVTETEVPHRGWATRAL